jgi:hypothetical protein
MRVIAVIDDQQVVEKILRSLGSWRGSPLLRTAGVLWHLARGPACRMATQPMPDYENVLTP